ncbi:ABC transporter substrate-binding protein [Streptomyces sp. DSM 44917]|uniref:ABC transporter substrate-binding protein n=1 Tax=Streptomyces boetiae TaxID=3075541 RepID=A0ABU2LA19_9ACTN|nr:ABC transporter substrate-binding protein [Streptomyces sp. DSM 44917]MDT0308417.1 ABC transporter substrate-binding protein [Streptomyces sp. DSM 44917]
MSTSGGYGGQDPDPSWWRGWSARGLVLACALAVTAGAVWWAQPEDTGCGPGVEWVGEGEHRACVGVTDAAGGFSFDPELDRVTARIAQENDRVTDAAGEDGGTPFVSVVYAMPMSPASGESMVSVRHELEGAYAGLIAANQTRGQGNSPQIRLLLGNTGATDEQWRHTSDQILGQAREERVVAVAGLGTSLAPTLDMVEALTAADIPVFGGTLTADDLEELDGLVRAAPPNSDEAAAAVQFLRTEERADDRVLVVQDQDEDDRYAATLGRAFLDLLPPGRLADDEPMVFDSSQGDPSSYFAQQMANLCLAEPDVVYFAGRSTELRSFLAPLARRYCNDRPLTVLSGDDASQTTQQEGFEEIAQALEDGNIELVYTGLAHPGAWEQSPEAFDRLALAPFRAEDGPLTELDDGQAIMGHDAVLMAVRAIRSTGRDRDLSAADVLRMLPSLNGANAIPGASGWISLRNNGSPENKAIPVISIEPNGRLVTLMVTSAGGEPYLPPTRGD